MILTTEQKRLYQELQETDTELFDFPLATACSL